MVETIAPVVHGDNRGRYVVALALHALGATVAAAVFGALLGAAGALLGAPWGSAGALLLALLATLYALGALGMVTLPVPQRRRQVPSWWRTFFSPGMAALLYGMGLGVGFLTYVSFGTLVAVALAAALTGGPLQGAAMMAPFGVARALAVAVAHRWEPRDPGLVIGALERLAASRVPAFVNGATLVALALAALFPLL